MKRTLLPLPLAIALFASPGSALQELNASGGELIPEQACFDVQRYDLKLRVDPTAKSIEGTLSMTAIAVAEIERFALDLDDHLEVEDVRSDGELDWEFRERRIWIDLKKPVRAGESFTVAVDYGGKPRVAPRPPWDGGFTWSKTADGSPWIATSCQGEGADLWWPCKDHPSDKPNGMDLAIVVPKGLVCATNGKLIGEETKAGWTTWTWKLDSPVSNYAVALNIAPYEVIESSWKSVDGTTVPVFFYALPESVEKARERLPELIDHMRFFEEFLGPYPFRAEKYGVVETPHLGMEHQTIIAYGYGFKHNNFGYDWLHHHEASHEWWSNLVTCADWKDMWIHEGFGTYMQALYVERLKGKKGLRRELANQRRGVGNRVPVAPRETQDSKQIYFGGGGGNDIYNKGSLVLHTLRWHMGDEDFFKALRTFTYPTEAHEKATDGSQVRLVDTDDFREICEAIEGEDLTWFFDVYLHQPKLPKLIVKRDGKKLMLEWETPIDVEFPLAIPLRSKSTGKDIRQAPTIGSDLIVDKDGDLEIDPDLWILCEIER